MKQQTIFIRAAMGSLAAILVSLGLAGCGVKKANGSRSYEFTAVSRGSLERTVSSSGTLEPVAQVKVLPRMSGKVEQVFVDYNEPVKQGDILAVLNTDMLRLQVEQQRASVTKARANYELQLVNYQNQRQLAEKRLISEYELRTSKTTVDVQAADLAAAEANLKVIETQINQYAYITSPINGIVLARNISAGDTVVDSSSNNSSSIFTLAENLEEMRIEAGVGELDVASIYKGQPVRFTLESLPGRTFTGEVETLRLIPTVSSNVVSYTVIINVKNRDGSLLPGMTCAVEFIVERSENILMVPNAALRYQPSNLSAAEIADVVFNAGLRGMTDDQRVAAVEARAQAQAAQSSAPAAPAAGAGTGITGLVTGGGAAPGMMGGRGGFGGGPGGPPPAQSVLGNRQNAEGTVTGGGPPVTMRNIWYINGEGKPDVIRVRAGITNGNFTEVRSTEDLEGMQIILREKV